MQTEEHKEACEALEEDGWCVCVRCGAKTTCEQNMAMHYAGRKHQQRMDLLICDICGVRTTCQKNMAEHKRNRHYASQVPML